MEDIQKVIDLLGTDYLSDVEQEMINSFRNNIGKEYYDAEDKKTYLYTESQFENDKKIREKTAFLKQVEKIKKDALLKVIQNKYTKYYSDIIDYAEPEQLAKILPDLASLKEKQEEMEDLKTGKIMFITFAPQKSVDVYELIKYLEQLTKFKFIKKYLYVLEQRFDGEPNEKYKKEGDGMHAHLLIDKDTYKTSHVKRDVRRVFKNMVCNIDYAFRSERDIGKTQKYMIGDKKDPSKQIKQKYDRVWRQAMGLKNFYGDLFQDMDEQSA